MTTLLTTVIGLIGVYIAFALAASWVNEQIATFLGLRSKTLIAGIRSMIGNAASTDFFGHPLIVSLGEVPAKNVWAKLGTLTGLKYFTQSSSTNPQQSATTKNPPYVSSAHFAVVVLDLLRKQVPAGVPTPALSAAGQAIADAMNAIGTPGNAYKPLYDILLPIWTNAKGDYDRFATDLGSWYDSQMDRVTGWYKRSVQCILVYIGFAIAFGLNVDTVQIVHALQQNAALASTVASATQAFYETNEGTLFAPSPAPDSAKPTPQGVISLPALSLSQACQSLKPCVCPDGFVVVGVPTKPNQHCEIDQSGFSQLPIGWNGSRWAAFRSNPTFFGLKILGLALTTVAILLGAPFWFDLLGAIVNVRSTGTKPASSSAPTPPRTPATTAT